METRTLIDNLWMDEAVDYRPNVQAILADLVTRLEALENKVLTLEDLEAGIKALEEEGAAVGQPLTQRQVEAMTDDSGTSRRPANAASSPRDTGSPTTGSPSDAEVEFTLRQTKASWPRHQPDTGSGPAGQDYVSQTLVLEQLSKWSAETLAQVAAQITSTLASLGSPPSEEPTTSQGSSSQGSSDLE